MYMKKIGIVTIYDLTNYGNRLQNYAVKKILRDVYDGRIKEINAVNHFLLLKNLIRYKKASCKRMLKFYSFSARSRDIEYLCDYNDNEYDYVICGILIGQVMSLCLLHLLQRKRESHMQQVLEFPRYQKKRKNNT